MTRDTRELKNERRTAGTAQKKTRASAANGCHPKPEGTGGDQEKDKMGPPDSLPVLAPGDSGSWTRGKRTSYARRTRFEVEQKGGSQANQPRDNRFRAQKALSYNRNHRGGWTGSG